MKKRIRIGLVASLMATAAFAAEYPKPVSGNFRIAKFRFASGETIPELTIHYRTIGTPRRDEKGVVRNAVLVLHGTTGSGRGFLTPNFAGVLFGPGQMLDASKLLVMTSSPLQSHAAAPTREAADRLLADQMKARLAGADANDFLYAFEASRDYDPSGSLEKIQAPLLAINSADDVVNPPELGLMERLIPRVRNGRYVLIPTGPESRGHGTHSWPAVWGDHLRKFLENLPQR